MDNISKYDIQMKYETGEMTVNLYSFLDIKTVNDTKKLIKIAEESDSLRPLCTAAENILDMIISRANQDASFWYTNITYISNMVNDGMIDRQYAKIRLDSVQKMIKKNVKQNTRIFNKTVKLINELQKIMPLDDLTELRKKQTIAEKAITKSEVKTT